MAQPNPLQIDYVVINPNQLADTLSAIPSHLDHAIDTETNGDNPHSDEVVLIQVAVTGHPVYLIPTEEMEEKHIELLNQHFQKPFLKLFHNGKFDLKMLLGMGIQVAPPYYDTLITSRLLRCGEDVKHGLGAVVWEHLGIKLDKSLQSSFLGSIKDLTPEQQLYGAIDAYVLHPLKQAFQTQLAKFSVTQPIAQQEFTLLRVLSQLEYRGMGVDVVQLQECLTQHTQRLTSLTKALQSATGGSVQTKLFVTANARPDLHEACLSAKDTQALLQSKGIPTKSGDTDYLLTQSQHPLIGQILEYRWACQHSKGLEAFISQCGQEGIYYPDYNQIERMTGQIVLSKEEAVLSAMTVMGVDHPADFCFTATPGYILNWLSFPELPLRVLATISQDTTLLHDLFAVRGEVGVTHSRLTQLICSSEGKIQGIDHSKVVYTSKSIQQLIQPVVEALLWAVGIGGWGAVRVQRHLYETTGLVFPKKQMQEWISQFWQIYPQLKVYHQQIKVRDLSTNKSLLGRYRRNVRVSPDEQSIRLVMGSVSDILKLAICEIEAQLTQQSINGQVALLLQHHIAIEVREDEEPRTHFLCNHLASCIKKAVPNLPLLIELF